MATATAAATTKYHLVVVKTDTSTGTSTHTAKKFELKADSDALDSVVSAISGTPGGLDNVKRNVVMTSLVQLVDAGASFGVSSP